MATTQSLTISVTAPEDHPAGEPIFLASSANDWQPNDEQYRFRADPADHTFWLEMALPLNALTYKFTRGSWDTVEVYKEGQSIENRLWTPHTDQSQITNRISGWRDLFGQLDADLEEVTVYVWHEALWMPSLQRHRRIWVYLPPDYEESGRQYPVIYMHDAQNLFALAESPYEKWRVARTLNRLFAETNWGCIVIGIDHGDSQRLNEYTPVVNPRYGGGDGLAYLDFISHTLKPLTDATFRTRPDAANTTMIGSSMGGLISIYAALYQGDVFGKVAAFSPSLWWSDDLYELAAAAPFNFVHKLLLLGGEQESDTMLSDLLALYNTLIDNGYFEHKLRLDFYQDGTHTERFWGRELERAIRWLFSDELIPMPEPPVAEYDPLTRDLRLLKPVKKAELLNGYGKIIYSLGASDVRSIPIQPHWRGLFVLKCWLANQRIELKKVVL